MTRTCSAIVLALALGLCGCAAKPPAAAGPGAEFGIVILAIHLLSDGDLVQLDYRVLDYEKARKALQGEIRIQAQDASRGIGVLDLGRLGPMKQRPARSGTRQFMLFSNSGRALKKGGSAAVILGGGRIDGIQIT